MTNATTTRNFALLLACAGGLALAPAGQEALAAAGSSGTISGKVLVKGGGPLAGATVAVKGTALKTSSGKDGRYTLSAVPAGSQSVSCSKPGYSSQTAFVTVPAGGAVSADFALTKEVGSQARASEDEAPAGQAKSVAIASESVASGAGGGGFGGAKPSQAKAGGAPSKKEAKSAPPMAMADMPAAPPPPPSPAPSVAPAAQPAKPSKVKNGGGAAAPADSQPQAATVPAPKPEPRRASGPTVKYLSADDSNSAASPVIARKLIKSGRYVNPDLVRTYEFLNWFSFDYPAPAADQPIAIHASLRPAEKPGQHNLQIAVRGPERRREQMLPLAITALLDTSGSMAGRPAELARKTLERLVASLRPGDSLALVTFNRSAAVLWPMTPVGPDTWSTLAPLLEGQAQASDITDLESGLKLAYQVAAATAKPERASRVVLLSDGATNAGQLGKDLIAKHAADSDRQGIYLTGLAFGDGFDDSLMNAVTDKGRGAYLFVDSPAELERIFEARAFVANFDVAVKDVRLKLVMPPGWSVEEFHGEQMASTAAEVVPQYLSPNDQMIYHLTIGCDLAPDARGASEFEFEAEVTPIGGQPGKVTVVRTVKDMLDTPAGAKGDAVVRYAEVLKKIAYPFEEHKAKNLEHLDAALATITTLNERLKDEELEAALATLRYYRRLAEHGEDFSDARDKTSDAPDAVLGLPASAVRAVRVDGPRTDVAIQGLRRLGRSTRLLPLEGHRFLCLASGPVGSRNVTGGGQLHGAAMPDPMPAFLGDKPTRSDGRSVFDRHQVILELTAPPEARSLSFEFNYFSAEYPQYVNSNYNDTFYAILEASSTNQGKPTNISFDPKRNAIEVDNSYFQNPFHPIPNVGTGFDSHGSTGWLRTSWPIKGGEQFTLTFSIHDEGDAIYDSLVVLDNLRFNSYPAVGTTDPLN